MGRLLIFLLIIAAVVLLWMAFKPSTWKRNQQQIRAEAAPKQVKGPDDDEDFLWTIEKNRFKERRAQEAARVEEEERMKRARERYETPENGDSGTPESGTAEDTPEQP